MKTHNMRNKEIVEDESCMNVCCSMCCVWGGGCLCVLERLVGTKLAGKIRR